MLFITRRGGKIRGFDGGSNRDTKMLASGEYLIFSDNQNAYGFVAFTNLRR